MITIQKQRALLVLAVATATVLAAAAAGAAGDKDGEKTGNKTKTKTRRGGHPTYLYADSAFAPAEVNRVALVAFTNATTTANAVDYFYRTLKETLREKPRYAVMDLAQVQREAAKQNVKEDHQALIRQWEDHRTLVAETVRHFASALNAPLIMAGEISEWQSEQVAWNVEGYSHSDVEVSLKLYSGETGALVWEARDKVELKSAPHDPRASSGVVDDMNIQRGSGQVVPPAPPIDDAAEDVAKNLVKALP
jgi:hypothetical protein